MGRMRKTPTEQMIDAVCAIHEDECPTLPATFLRGLRGALDAGLSAEQITALLVLFTGIYEASKKVPQDELIHRACLLANVMKGDIVDLSEQRSQAEANREYRRQREEQIRQEKIARLRAKIEAEENGLEDWENGGSED